VKIHFETPTCIVGAVYSNKIEVFDGFESWFYCCSYRCWCQV